MATIVLTFFRLFDKVIDWVTTVAMLNIFVKSVSVSLLLTVRTRDDRNTCCELIRPRSLPSPTPWRLRRNIKAS